MGRARLARRWVALLLVLSVVLPATVLADDLTGVGDTDLNGKIYLSIGDVVVGELATGTAELKIGRDRDGSEYADGSKVIVSAGTGLPVGVVVDCGGDAEIVLPDNWSTLVNNTLSTDSAYCAVSILTAGLPLGSHEVSLGMQASGTRVIGGSTYPLVRTADLVVSFTVVEQPNPDPVYTLSGFYAPVKDGLNVVKGGRIIPLKFQVFEGETEINDLTSVSLTVTPFECGGDVSGDAMEGVDAGATGLRYDDATGMFIKNWRTPATPGLCYQVTVSAGEDAGQDSESVVFMVR